MNDFRFFVVCDVMSMDERKKMFVGRCSFLFHLRRTNSSDEKREDNETFDERKSRSFGLLLFPSLLFSVDLQEIEMVHSLDRYCSSHHCKSLVDRWMLICV
jgi:hypothetical protein